MGVLTVGSLFSGIGGFDLGLERAGLRVVWQCESDEFCRRVLARHWPGVPCYPDVRALVADTESRKGRKNGADVPRQGVGGIAREEGGRRTRGFGGASGEGVPVPVPYVDVLAGGFPCQDISVAGKGAGIDGARSGLWGQFARLIGELRPRYVVVENVPALLARGMGRVLGDLAACGYDAEWDCLPASAFGAPHRRDRIWLVAYPNPDSGGLEVGTERDGDTARSCFAASRRDDADELHSNVADAEVVSLRAGLREDESRGIGRRRSGDGSGAGAMGYAVCYGRGPRRQGRSDPAGARQQQSALQGAHAGSAGSQGNGQEEAAWHGDWWFVEPDVGRVANGVPAWVDRLRALGNALVPQIAEWIGERILTFELSAGAVA